MILNYLIPSLIAVLSLFFVRILIKGRLRVSKHTKNIETAGVVLCRLRGLTSEVFYRARIINYLKKINPYVFEELLLTAFEEKGFKVLRNTRYTGDGGFDGIVIDSDGQKCLVQAKRYEAYVSSSHLREFKELVFVMGLKKGYFVHTGKTGGDVYRTYNSGSIEIISGSRLVELILN